MSKPTTAELVSFLHHRADTRASNTPMKKVVSMLRQAADRLETAEQQLSKVREYAESIDDGMTGSKMWRIRTDLLALIGDSHE